MKGGGRTGGGAGVEVDGHQVVGIAQRRVLRQEHEVLRLYVAMSNTAGMHVDQHLQQLACDHVHQSVITRDWCQVLVQTAPSARPASSIHDVTPYFQYAALDIAGMG